MVHIQLGLVEGQLCGGGGEDLESMGELVQNLKQLIELTEGEQCIAESFMDSLVKL